MHVLNNASKSYPPLTSFRNARRMCAVRKLSIQVVKSGNFQMHESTLTAEKMFVIKVILGLLITVRSVWGSYSGPYLLWGVKNLEQVKLPALEAIDERTLTSLYSDAKAVVIFVRNSTSRLDQINFPKFKELIDKNKWTYLPQTSLPAEPVDYNANVEQISLVGPASQQDIELSALYNDAVTIYGEGEVLGILANQADEGHYIFKRDAEDIPTSTVSPTDEPMQANCIYLAKQGLMYTSSPPLLTLEINNNTVTKELTEHGIVTDDNRAQTANMYRLIITFKSVIVRFRFQVESNYWSLVGVEVDTKEQDVKAYLVLEGELPYAPVGFSYSCSRPLVFRNGTNILKMKDIQVQPLLSDGQRKFNDAFDCIGFMTAPIWSGIFVSALVLFGTILGIIALMDIKTPNRFESNRNKQLTFTVQE